MLILLSPSKTLGDGTSPQPVTPTQPALLKHTQELAKTTKKLSEKQLKVLMDISDKLAALNHERFQRFKTPFTPANASPALFTFQGDVYDGLDATSLTAKEVAYAQEHLRILSGFYGLLRPLDLMQPYRLEMGIALPTSRGKNLYGFWGEFITQRINHDAAACKAKAVINLASEEYFKAVQPKALALPVITPIFQEKRGKTRKTIGLMAKRARGNMARWIIRQHIATPIALCRFAEGGYAFDPESSSDTRLFFVR